jgi:hypothetical protein
LHAKYWLARWEEARTQTALALPFVGRGVVYAYLWASLVVLAAIAAVGELSWAAVAGVMGPTIILTVAAFGYDIYELFKIIPERDQMLTEKAGERLTERVGETPRLPRPEIQFTDHRTRLNIAVPGLAVAGERPARIQNDQAVGRVDICQVALRNKPPATAKGSTAEHAVALVEYFLPEGKEPVLVLDHGRWADNLLADSRNTPASLDSLLRRDLYANGEAHWIDVALKAKGDAEWYALDAAASRERGWKDPNYAMAHSEMRVRITVLAEGMDHAISAEYWLYNHGTDTIDISDTRRSQQNRSQQSQAGASRMAAPKENTERPERSDRPLIRDEFFSDLAKVSRKASSKKSAQATTAPSPTEE